MNRLSLCVKSLTSLRSLNYEGQRNIKRWVAPTLMEITRRKRKLPRQPLIKRSTFLEWNRDSEIYAFNQRLSEKFQEDKLQQAFTHKSYIFCEEKRQKDMGIKEPKLDILDNEDLIAKGNAFTSEVVTKYLFSTLPRAPDSVIKVLHDYLMSERILAKASLHIGTKELILTEEYPAYRETLAKTFLALVAALIESVDENHASIFVRDFLIVGLAEKDLSELWCPEEPIELLNTFLSQEQRAPVEPRIISKTGTNTILSAYQIAMYSNKQFLGSGFGQTIEEAKKVAATNALCRIFGLLDSNQPIRFNVNVDMPS